MAYRRLNHNPIKYYFMMKMVQPVLQDEIRLCGKFTLVLSEDEAKIYLLLFGFMVIVKARSIHFSSLILL